MVNRWWQRTTEHWGEVVSRTCERFSEWDAAFPVYGIPRSNEDQCRYKDTVVNQIPFSRATLDLGAEDRAWKAESRRERREAWQCFRHDPVYRAYCGSMVRRAARIFREERRAVLAEKAVERART